MKIQNADNCKSVDAKQAEKPQDHPVWTLIEQYLPQPKRKPPMEASKAMKRVRPPIGVPRTVKTMLKS